MLFPFYRWWNPVRQIKWLAQGHKLISGSVRTLNSYTVQKFGSVFKVIRLFIFFLSFLAKQKNIYEAKPERTCWSGALTSQEHSWPLMLWAPLQQGFLLWLLPLWLVPTPHQLRLTTNVGTLALCMVRFGTKDEGKQVEVSKNQTHGGRGGYQSFQNVLTGVPATLCDVTCA